MKLWGFPSPSTPACPISVSRHVLERCLNSLNIEKASNKIVLKFHKGAISEHEDCYGTFMKLARNSEYSKSHNF